MGNFIFGCFLGSTATIGYMLGLPIDIRHIAFASANFVHGLFYLAPEDFSLGVAVISFIGVLLIGLVNLMVSFSLALMVAMRSKNVDGFEWRRISELVFKHFVKRPQDFFWPRTETVKYAKITSDGQMIFEQGERKDKPLSDNYVIRRLPSKKGEIIEVVIPDGDTSDDKSQISKAIKAYHNDEAAPTEPQKDDSEGQISPLPKPDKPPQLPK